MGGAPSLTFDKIDARVKWLKSHRHQAAHQQENVHQNSSAACVLLKTFDICGVYAIVPTLIL